MADEYENIIDYIMTLIPPDAKHSSTGWYTWSCQSCGRVEGTGKNDRKNRGGMRIDSVGFIYHCFNCGYVCGYTVGQPLSHKVVALFEDLGCSSDQISKLKMMAIKALSEENASAFQKMEKRRIIRSIPMGYVKLVDNIEKYKTNRLQNKIITYLNSRNPSMIEWCDIYWSPANSTIEQFLVPTYENGQMVGYILRNLQVDDTHPKYINQIPKGHIYNGDLANASRKYNILVEGLFDGIAINGMALLGNDVTTEKMSQIKYATTKSEVIYVPDRDAPGFVPVQKFYDNSLDIKISMPTNWDNSIKDTFDAVNKYGRIKVIEDIIQNKMPLLTGVIKAKEWCKINEQPKVIKKYKKERNYDVL